MGWTALSGSIEPTALLLGGVLFAWQFPHFNSLSFNIREQYAKAGYRMMSVLRPRLNARTALTYSLWLIPITCLAASPWTNLTYSFFAIDGNAVNAVLVYYAWIFYRRMDRASARKLFLFTLIHLPLYMILMVCHRKKPQAVVQE